MPDAAIEQAVYERYAEALGRAATATGNPASYYRDLAERYAALCMPQTMGADARLRFAYDALTSAVEVSGWGGADIDRLYRRAGVQMAGAVAAAELDRDRPMAERRCESCGATFRPSYLRGDQADEGMRYCPACLAGQ